MGNVKILRRRVKVSPLYALHMIIDVHNWSYVNHDGIGYRVCECGRVEMHSNLDDKWTTSQHDVEELNDNMAYTDKPHVTYQRSQEFAASCHEAGIVYKI